jgi:chaperone BCS1
MSHRHFRNNTFSSYRALKYGAPGTGKTSLIHSLAGELGLTIYVISLSHPDLNDTNLREIMSELPGKVY